METLLSYLVYIFIGLGVIAGLLALTHFRKKTRKKDSGHKNGTDSGRSWFEKKWWWITPIIISIVALGLWKAGDKLDTVLEFIMKWSPLSESPSLKTVAAFAQNYWLTIFAVYVFLAITATIVLYKNGAREWNATAQKILAGGVFTLLVVLPCWFWISSPSTSGEKVATASLKIPDASEDETKWPESFWAKIELSKEGEESGLLPVKVGKRLVMFGTKDFGVNCIYRDGHKTSFGKGEQSCPNGDMPWNSVTNKAGEPNIIYFAYRPI